MLRATWDDEVEVARQAAHVVTGLIEVVERVGQLDRAVVAPADEEVLELRAEHELVAERTGALELAPQDRARAVGPLLALHVHVAGEAGHLGPPRQRREGCGCPASPPGRVVWLLADRRPAAKPAKPAPSLSRPSRRARGHELRVRLAVHVDELGEEELDVVLADVALDVLARLGGGEGLAVHGGQTIPFPKPGQCEKRTYRSPRIVRAGPWARARAAPTLGRGRAMCGIAGLFSKSLDVSERLGGHLGEMLLQLSDRGPDSAGVAVLPRSGAGRLVARCRCSARPG